MSKNKAAVISGASKVCVQTATKRMISRRANVYRPSQLTRPNRRSRIAPAPIST